MSYQIVKLEDFTGGQATIYSVIEEDEELTAFEKFISKHDSDNLSREANRMIKVSNDILQRIKDKKIQWSSDGREFMGDLTFITYE